MVENALDTSEDVDPKGQIEQAESALYRVAEEGGAESSVKTFAEATRMAVQLAEKALNTGGGLSGVTTGLDGINAKTGGLHHSDLVILAGRPGMGKTALATNIAYNAAARYLRDLEDGIPAEKSAGAPVAFFSLEMSADQLATRILAEQSGISGENLRMGKISQTDFRNLARAAAELESLPLYIDDTAGLTIAALRTRARRLKRQRGIGMIVVDYLQLLQGSGKSGGDQNRVQEISEISRGLKTLAKELHVPCSPSPSSAAPSSSARTSARSFPTFANPARSSRTPTWSGSSTARNIMSSPRSPSGRWTATTARSSKPTTSGPATWSGSTAWPS
jgi:replicative DNA helicase